MGREPNFYIRVTYLCSICSRMKYVDEAWPA
jgi:hypothetical protein